eukprot:2226735-Amphidinium_carterae.1
MTSDYSKPKGLLEPAATYANKSSCTQPCRKAKLLTSQEMIEVGKVKSKPAYSKSLRQSACQTSKGHAQRDCDI